jgi:hypothetical protein
LVIARAGTLAALAVIAAAIGAGLGYAALVLMAAASWTREIPPKTAADGGSRQPISGRSGTMPRNTGWPIGRGIIR